MVTPASTKSGAAKHLKPGLLWSLIIKRLCGCDPDPTAKILIHDPKIRLSLIPYFIADPDPWSKNMLIPDPVFHIKSWSMIQKYAYPWSHIS